MKKTLLFMALAATYASAFAQDADTTTPLDGYTQAGWYTIQCVSGQTDLVNKYAVNYENEFYQTANARWYPLGYEEVSELTPIHYIYVSRIGEPTTASGMTTANYNIRGLNGHYINREVIARTSPYTVEVLTGTSGSTTRNVRIGIWATYNTGNYHNIGGSNGSNNGWRIIPVDTSEIEATYDVWTVAIEHDITDGVGVSNQTSVTLNNEENKGLAKVYNGGHYFVTKGTEITAEQISVTTPTEMAGNTDHNVIIDTTNHTITIEFLTISDDVIAASLREANLLANYHVLGYANDNSELLDAVNVYTGSSNQSDYAVRKVLVDALENYKADISNNQELPQDGKAYAFVNIHQAIGYSLLNVVDNAIAATEYTATEEIPSSAIFVAARKNDSGQYIFAHDNGSYLVWKGGATNYGDGSGLTTDLSAVNNYIAFEHYGQGEYSVYGKRNSSDYPQSVYVVDSSRNFNHASTGSGSNFYTATYSSHFAIVEVEYPHNTVTFKPLAEADPATETTGEPVDLTYSSIYLPFAVKLPVDSDVHAMAVSAVDDETNALTLTEFGTDGIIPANTAAILIKRDSNVETSEVLVPATAAGTALESEANLLVGYSNTGTAPEGGHSALSHDNGGFATSAEKPAYTALLAHTNLNEGSTDTYSMAVPSDIATSITEVETVAPAAQAIYDLQGRRVAHASKGIFIINGKKTLVK